MKRATDGRRRGGRVASALIGAALLCLWAAPTALSASSVYWVNAMANKISFAALDGSGGGDLGTGAATVSTPFGTAIDVAAGRIYWTNYVANRISFAKLDGSGGGEVATGGATVNTPMGIAIDAAAGRVYWANSGASKISYADLDGSGAGDLATGSATVSMPVGVAVDPAAGRIYWANYGANKISYARLDGTGGADLVTTAISPAGVAVDPAAGRIYWTGYAASGKISYASLDGSGGGDVNTAGATASFPEGVALDPAAGRVYWGNNGTAKISFARLDGSGGADLATTGATTNGSVFPALLEVPSGTGAPVIGGGSAVGAALSCSQGAWGSDVPSAFFYRAPASFGYQWSVNGADVAGANQSSIVAGAPGDYRCRVSAANPAGATAQTSAAHAVLAALTTSISGSGSGKVSGAGISCPRDCRESYAAGTTVTLTARAASRSRFVGWGGACSGRGRCRLTIAANRAVSARFKALAPNTKIARARISSAKRRATFSFKALGKATRWQCSLRRGHRKATFKSCRSPKAYKHLKRGRYTFTVRALGPGGRDRSPARKTFTIR